MLTAPKGGAASLRVAALSKRELARLAAGGRVALRVRVPAPGKVRAVVGGRLGGHRRTLARAQRRAKKLGTVALPLRLSRPALRYLARGGHLPITVRVTAAGEARTVRAKLAPPHAKDHKGDGR
jgi:hypothetical protein